MKKVFLFCVLAISLSSQAQYDGGFFAENKIRLGAGYTHDFPGLNGYTVSGEFSRKMNDFLEAAVGLQLVNLNGTPRSAQVKEFTKATTLDFKIYFVPLQNESHNVRIGAGYNFSFYKIRRGYAVSQQHGDAVPTIGFYAQEAKGRTGGINLTGEYEYALTGQISVGLRASYFKAFDGVTYIGPFVGIGL